MPAAVLVVYYRLCCSQGLKRLLYIFHFAIAQADSTGASCPQLGPADSFTGSGS
jgi:hypothetical protein